MKIQIKETKDYDKFELYAFNRNINSTRVKRLERSLRDYGWLPAYPMHVVQNGNNKLKIKDGHNRFEAAKRLGMSVKYVVCADKIPIHEIDETMGKWSLKDYLDSYFRAGVPAYHTVAQYHKKTGINLKRCIGLLGGVSPSSGGHRSLSFKQGRFQLGDASHATLIADIVTHCRNEGIKWANNGLFVEALSRIAYLPEFDTDTFKSKASSFKYLFEKQPNVEAYAQMIQDIYNRYNTNKIPLVFLANEAAKKRCLVQNNGNGASQPMLKLA